MVYWRRRLLFGLAAVMTLILLVQIFSGGDEKLATVTPVATDAPIPTVVVTPGTSDLPVEASAAPATQTLQPTAQPTVQVIAEGECLDADTSIRVEIDRTTTTVGEGVHIKMIIKNNSAKTCKRDVGSGANEVTVISGPALIWSTDHCNPSTDKDLQELAPGQEWSANVVWIGKQTAKGCKVRNMAEPGAYWAHGRNGSLNSAGARFTVE